MKVLIVVAVLGAALCALTWWTSGRSRRRFPGGRAEHEVARGLGTLQGQEWQRRDHGPMGR